VKVIVAHCALPFEPTDIMSDSSFFELVSLFQRAVERNWKLYADLSALNILRGNYTKAVQNYLPIDKMLFASDYPIPMFNFGYSKFTSLRNWISQFWRILTTSNPFDRNYELLKSKGFDTNTLCAATGILRMPS
jgi:predicted TIM-barrel fold metal-dependent hydrolase